MNPPSMQNLDLSYNDIVSLRSVKPPAGAIEGPGADQQVRRSRLCDGTYRVTVPPLQAAISAVLFEALGDGQATKAPEDTPAVVDAPAAEVRRGLPLEGCAERRAGRFFSRCRTGRVRRRASRQARP